ncbi:MAG: hypothetical protein AB7C91_03260 [Sphaerochaeta sp.]|uniref:hypothetical protein n=1 Tax=Sphaerochaeta sp. TaxID=1972642 RepID=UPI003D13675B
MDRMHIGGMFPLERPLPVQTGFFSNRGEDLRFFLSGRCALYTCLLDTGIQDRRNVAYVPAYTCETVLSSYEKAGFTLRFYDIKKTDLSPMWKLSDLAGVSVLNVCGYYGFSRYDHQFLEVCRREGILIVQDITHSMFSVDGYYPFADYWAGSARKWMGIASGGVAIKAKGRFNVPLLPPDPQHLAGRRLAMEYRRQAIEQADVQYDEQATRVFWETEMRLRSMFDAFAGDPESEQILQSCDVTSLRAQRRENYQTLLSHYHASGACTALFPELDPDSCPSHFTFYSEDREQTQAKLAAWGIKSTVYWPVPPMLDQMTYPSASWIYEHVLSVQIDQRYHTSEMEYLAAMLSRL